jgi:thiol-disulfide isomerase/thioredoxin
MKGQDKRFFMIVLLVIIFLAILLNKRTENFTSHPEFTMYYTDWCGYSQKALPEFNNIGSEVTSDSGQIIKIKKVDCVKNKELCYKARIEGYPTMILEDGSKRVEYNGPRETEKMLEFLKRQ